jgi:hypothetical protein
MRQKCCHLTPICSVPSCINSSFSIVCSFTRSAQRAAPSDRHLTPVLSNKNYLQKFWVDLLARTKSASRLSAHFRTQQFLGAFAKQRKATISFVTSVCPQEATRLPFDEFSWNVVWVFFGKSLWGIQVAFKLDKSNGYMKTTYILDHISLSSS